MNFGLLLRFQSTYDFFERVKRDDFSTVPAVPDADVIWDDIRLAELADGLGFDSLWVSEEHLGPVGMASDPFLLLALLLGHTRSASLCGRFSVAPLVDPLRFVESLSLFDAMAGARRGSIALGHEAPPHEFMAFGIADGSLASRTDELFEILARASRDEWFEFQGEHYSIPVSTVRPRSDASVTSRLYACAGNASGHRLNGSATGVLYGYDAGLDSIVGQASLDDTEKTGASRNRRRPAIVRPVFCSSVPSEVEQARQWWAQSFDADVWHFGVNHHPFLRPLVAGKEGLSLSTAINEGYQRSRELGIFGTPEECSAQIERMRDRVGDFALVAHMNFGLMPAEICESSVRLFADAVIPNLSRRK